LPEQRSLKPSGPVVSLCTCFRAAPYTGFGDLRPFHPKDVSFIGQAFHATKKQIYNDTMNFLIYAPTPQLPANTTSTMLVHSISQIGGAYCDDGQNYKNIAVLLNSLGFRYDELSSTGCPAKNKKQLQ